MRTFLLLMPLFLSAAVRISAQTTEGAFSKMEITNGKGIAGYKFIDKKEETEIHLIKGRDTLRTYICGDYMRNKYVLKENNGVKTLLIYLRPNWKFKHINGTRFGKTYIKDVRIQ